MVSRRRKSGSGSGRRHGHSTGVVAWMDPRDFVFPDEDAVVGQGLVSVVKRAFYVSSG